MTAAITDFTQFSTLRAGAEKNDPEVLREVAGQFEALFLQTILKNMRASELADPLLGDSDQHEMYQGMMDQQLAMEMSSGRGIGLAEMLVRQLGGEPGSISATREVFSLAAPPRSSVGNAEPTWADPDAFARDLWPHVNGVARELNIAPEALLAQAALETGWGAHVMERANGESSYNLFGIKAGRDWTGDSVARSTLEYSGGVARRSVERFKVYPDVAATFKDYVQLIKENPRYEKVRDNGADSVGFANALQESGYATDPAYARKIGGLVQGKTLRAAISGLKIESTPSINTDSRAAALQ